MTAWRPTLFLLLLTGLVAAGCATLDPAEAYREGQTLRFRGAGVSAPARLPGCGTVRILTRDDPVDGVAVYRCGRGVTLSIWTRSIGWRDPADAFENARALLPGAWASSQVAAKPGVVTLAGRPMAVRWVIHKDRSHLWLTPDGPAPKVVLEVAWRGENPVAQAESERAMAALLDVVQIP